MGALPLVLEVVAIAACRSGCTFRGIAALSTHAHMHAFIHAFIHSCIHSFVHSFIHAFILTRGYSVPALELLPASQRGVSSLRSLGQVGSPALCSWGRRGSQSPSPAFLPVTNPRASACVPPLTLLLHPCSSPGLNTSRPGSLVLFLKVWPVPLPTHPVPPGPHILVKVPQRQDPGSFLRWKLLQSKHRPDYDSPDRV